MSEADRIELLIKQVRELRLLTGRVLLMLEFIFKHLDIITDTERFEAVQVRLDCKGNNTVHGSITVLAPPTQPQN